MFLLLTLKKCGVSVVGFEQLNAGRIVLMKRIFFPYLENKMMKKIWAAAEYDVGNTSSN